MVTLNQARQIGANKGAVRQALSDKEAWKSYAKEKETELANLKEEYDKLSNKHIRMSQRYETLNTMLGWLNEGPSVTAIAAIHQMKARQMQWMANENYWGTDKRREENIRLMAEAEYDYHVLADPVYRLNNAAESLMKIADYAESEQAAEKINSLVMKMKNTGSARTEEHRENFLNARIKELTENVRYENEDSCTPVIDSIPEASQLDSVKEDPTDDWKVMNHPNDLDKLLIA